MSQGLNLMVAVGLFGLAGWALYTHLWRAVLCLAPGTLTLEAEKPPGQAPVPRSLEPLEAELKALGFVPLGSHVEKPRFAPETVAYDYGHPAELTFASLSQERAHAAQLYFLTHTGSGAFVLTANYRRPARETPGRYSAGGLEGAPAERIHKAHQRRVGALGSPVGLLSQEGRLEVARAWFAGPGRGEVRRQNLHGLLWTVGSLGMVGAAVFGKR